MDTATQEVAIRQRAYAIWETEGRPDGREWDHWLRASQEILSRVAIDPEPPAKAKPRKSTKGRNRSPVKSATAK